MHLDWEEIFNTYYDRIYSFTLFRVQNVSDSEDITSEVFLKVAKNIHRYDENKAAFSTWLFTIALNEIRTHYRKNKPTLPLQNEEIAATDLEPCEKVLRGEKTKSLYAAIGDLKERQRNIVLLKYYGEMTNRQIAELLNLTETNVETILSRSIKKLRDLLKKRE